MKTNLSRVALFGGLLLALAGCTFPSSRKTVPTAAANVVSRAEYGTVTSVRQVNIEGQKTNLGTFGGGMIGGAAASGGSGVPGRVVQATASVAGAIVGQSVEELATRKVAQEITVRMDDGNTVVVTQAVDGGLFMDGDRVRILNSGGYASVGISTN